MQKSRFESLHSPRIDRLMRTKSEDEEGPELYNGRQDQSDVSYDTSINSMLAFYLCEGQAPVRFEGDVGLKFSIFTIRPIELRVLLGANKDPYANATRSCEPDHDPSLRDLERNWTSPIRRIRRGPQAASRHLTTYSQPFHNTPD